MPKPINTAKQKKIKDFLKAKGRKVADVDKLKVDTEENLKKSMLELHKVSENEYRSGGVG